LSAESVLRFVRRSTVRWGGLDLLVDDLDTGEARALELGASRLNDGGERFRVFTDPAGHPFCLIR
jgi:Glyoxalase-like domain